jgi:hypothetical protein
MKTTCCLSFYSLPTGFSSPVEQERSYVQWELSIFLCLCCVAFCNPAEVEVCIADRSDATLTTSSVAHMISAQ